MRNAYDTMLSDCVDAKTAAKYGGFEPYRYKCACCWQEVRLCAADSKNQATHFRHHNGNNNVECENYLGNRSAIISNALSRENARDKIEFYFSNTTKLFYICVKFNTEEIAAHEQSGASFEVRIAPSSPPTISVPIRNIRFLPDVPELIPILEFSWEYYASITNDTKRRKYEVFYKDVRDTLYPSFFKIQADSDGNNFQAKLVRTKMLYTNTPYLIIFTHQYYPLSFQNDVEDVKMGEVINFRTMGRDFSGVVVTFINKTSNIEQQLATWKYTLEANETLSLLWPPSPQADGTLLIKENFAYIFSSFEIQAHGNINVHTENIIRLGDGVSRISINGRTKVYKKNAELQLDKYKRLVREYDSISVTHAVAKRYVASNNETYLFNRSGVMAMNNGMATSLTLASEVRHYTFGYLDYILTAIKNGASQDGGNLLGNILKYYKREEDFDWNDYDSLNLSPTAFEYIKLCEKSGRINAAAKHFIEEGCI